MIRMEAEIQDTQADERQARRCEQTEDVEAYVCAGGHSLEFPPEAAHV